MNSSSFFEPPATLLSGDPETLPHYVFVLNFLEIAQIFFALLWAPLSATVFLKRSLCHRNLVLIIMSTLFLYIILLLCRLAICISGVLDKRVLAERSLYIIWSPISYFEKGRIFAGYTAALQVSLIVIERCIATVNMQSYEKDSHIIILLFVILCTYCSGFYAAYLIFNSTEKLVYSCVGMCFVIGFVAIVFQYTICVSKRQLVNSKRLKNSYTLSQRFQLQENLRMIKILKRIMYSFILCVSTMILCFLFGVNFVKDPYGDSIYLLRGSINLLVSVNANLIVVAAITGTHVWRELLKRYLRSIFFCFAYQNRIGQIKKRMSVSTVNYLKNIDGLQLTFNLQDEQDIYFQQLKSAWG